ncbi:MAG: hypothetical protein ACYCV7_17150, partial [Acidimicrobiales bacterium]
GRRVTGHSWYVPVMPPRRRHPKKELEEILAEAEARGWRVESRTGYFKLKCSCDEKHYKTVHYSPSDPNYGKNLRA